MDYGIACFARSKQKLLEVGILFKELDGVYF